jgi:hypothetical protein
MRYISYLFLALALVRAEPAAAGLYGVQPLSRLIETADAIVAARVIGSVPFIPVTLDISKSFKGTLQPGSIASASVPHSVGARVPWLQDAYGVWFLKASGPEWTVLPTATGDISHEDLFYRLSEDAGETSLARGSFETVEDQVVAALSALLLRNDSGRLGPLAASFGIDSGQLRLSAALFGIDSDATRQLYRECVDHSDPSVRERGLVGLIYLGKKSAILKLTGEIEAGRISDSTPIALGIEAHFRNPDPEAIEALGKIVNSPKVSRELRVAAAYALEAIHTVETLPLLVQLLDSKDGALRYRGMFGLAAFANNYPMPTRENFANMGYLSPQTGDWPYRTEDTRQHVPGVDAFEADEQKYLDFWRNWYNDVRFDLQLPPNP